jgi:hypothetical protein
MLLKPNGDARLLELRKAVANIEEKLGDPHWSEASRQVLRQLRDRHLKSIEELVAKA